LWFFCFSWKEAQDNYFDKQVSLEKRKGGYAIIRAKYLNGFDTWMKVNGKWGGGMSKAEAITKKGSEK